MDRIKVDCSAFGTYIKTLPITKNTSTAIILNGYKEQLKSQYGDKLSDDVFNTIYEQTVAETVKEVKWTQPYDNAPIQVETKALFEQFITKLNAAVENAQLTEVVSYDELNDLYANMTSIRNDLSELLLPELNEDNYSVSHYSIP